MNNIILDNGQTATLSKPTKTKLYAKFQQLRQQNPHAQNYYLGVNYTEHGPQINSKVLTTNPEFTIYQTIDELSHFTPATIQKLLS